MGWIGKKTARRMACSEGCYQINNNHATYLAALRTAQEYSSSICRQGLSRHMLLRSAQSAIPRPLTCLKTLLFDWL